MTIDSKVLTRAAESMAEAVKHARLAYQFCPGSYTFTTLKACLTAAGAIDEHISALAFVHSAEWLRKLPRIEEQAARRQREEAQAHFAQRHGGLR
jgi:protein tyrosine phosphatase (PTP) superfamily phosphohydrolase (DUF442 family)